MERAPIHNITTNEWIQFDDFEYVSHFFIFPKLANCFNVKIFFPTDETEDILKMPIDVSVPAETTKASRRFRDALQDVNLSYTPMVNGVDPILFPTIKLNCAIHNCIGVLDNAEATRIKKSLFGYDPMILILTNVERLEGDTFSMFRQYGYDNFTIINQVIGVEKTHVLWCSSLVEIWIEEDISVATILFKAKGEEAWQKHCITNVDRGIKGLNLWRKMEKYVKLNFNPWRFLDDLQQV